MAGVKVRVIVNVPKLKDIEDRLKGPRFRRFLENVATDMGKQAALNVTKDGKPGGAYKQLSGFNANTQKAKGERVKAKAMRSGMSAGEARGLAKEEARKERAARKAHPQSKHLGYAREKEKKRDKGEYRHGPGERLMATGTLRESFDGEIAGNRVELVARGNNPGGPTNQELLEWHATGQGNLPVRNPASDMSNFIARTERRWRDLLGAPGGADKTTIS